MYPMRRASAAAMRTMSQMPMLLLSPVFAVSETAPVYAHASTAEIDKTDTAAESDMRAAEIFLIKLNFLFMVFFS